MLTLRNNSGRQSLVYFVRVELSALAESEGHLYPVVHLRLCIHASQPSHGYSLQGVTGIRNNAYGARSGPSLCHSVVTCTVV